MKIIFLDTETNNIIKDFTTSTAEFQKWPLITQLAWIIDDENGNTIRTNNFFIHGQHIKHKYQERAEKTTEKDALNCLMTDIIDSDLIVAHNYEFDYNIIDAACNRLETRNEMIGKDFICTMKAGTNFCNIKTENGLKYPTLIQLLYKVTEVPLPHQHEAFADAMMLKISFWGLFNLQVIPLQLPLRDRNRYIVFIEKLNSFIPYFCFCFFHKGTKIFYEAIINEKKFEVRGCSLKPLILNECSGEEKLKIIRILKNFEKTFMKYQRPGTFNKSGEIISDKYGFDIYSNFYSIISIQEAAKIDDASTKIAEIEDSLMKHLLKFKIDLNYLNEEFKMNEKKFSSYRAFEIYVEECYGYCLRSSIKIDYRKIYDFIALKQLTTFFYIVHSDVRKGIL